MAQLYNFEELFTTSLTNRLASCWRSSYVSVNLAEFGQHEGR